MPLIRLSSLAPQSAHAETARLKSEFHTSVRDFFSQAKKNIDQLAAELFYEEENDEDDEDEEEGGGDEAEPAGSEGQKRLTAGGDASATPEKKTNAPRLTSGGGGGSGADGTGAVTPALLSSTSHKQLGSPRKTQLLQQLMTLSAHMDEGLSAVSKAKEAAARAAKEATAASSRGGGAGSYDTRSHANKFNKLDIQQLAAMAREDASPRKGAASASGSGSGSGAKGAYPEVSEQTKRTVRCELACVHGGWETAGYTQAHVRARWLQLLCVAPL